ncbi:MAG TPA: hypothetical protein VE011_09525 [Candidatus Dormibacteraeota bacterium]|nr:hypothetical protein [Candidatus Dormibacteraeota bacterium]
MQPTLKVRPTGVTVLAVLAAIGGVLGILGGVALLGLGSLAVAGTGILGGAIAIFGLIAIVQSVLALAFAYGAWTLKPWAWTLGIVAEAIGIALSVLFIINGSSITSQAISIIIAGAIIYYLMTPAVKAAFGKA